MISEKHSQQARINGARSKGPKTARGKAFSSRNAMRHGLLSKVVVLRNESQDGFRQLFDAYADRFAPLDDVEIGLIEEMVAAYWHLRRAFAVETRTLDNDMAARHAPSELDRLAASFCELAATPKLALLHRYQTRLHLIHSRLLRDLVLMRSKLPDNSAEPNEPSNPFDFNETTDPEPSQTQVPPLDPTPPPPVSPVPVHLPSHPSPTSPAGLPGPEGVCPDQSDISSLKSAIPESAAKEKPLGCPEPPFCEPPSNAAVPSSCRERTTLSPPESWKAPVSKPYRSPASDSPEACSPGPTSALWT